jgi:hypothetical protein
VLEPVRLDEGRDERLIRDIEEHRARAYDDRNDDQLRETERVCPGCERNRDQREAAGDIGDDHRAPARPAVDQDPGGQPQQRVRRKLGCFQQSNLKGGRMHPEDGDRGQGERADRGTEDARGLARPEPVELPPACTHAESVRRSRGPFREQQEPFSTIASQVRSRDPRGSCWIVRMRQ